jgi:hypothetical protein
LIESNRQTVPKTISIRKDSKWHINPDFENFPMSVVVISSIASRSPAATTPIAYRRDLDPHSGQWGSASGDNSGIYGESGDINVFLDGHAEFYPNLTDAANMLVKHDTGERILKISEARNTGARALSWTGVEREAGNKKH